MKLNNKIVQTPSSSHTIHDNVNILLNALRSYLEFSKSPSQKIWGDTKMLFAKVNIPDDEKEKDPTSVEELMRELKHFVIKIHGYCEPHNLNKVKVTALITTLENFVLDQVDYDSMCVDVIAEINILLKTGYRTLVPCKETQSAVTMAINALNNYILHCMGGITNSWHFNEAQEQFSNMNSYDPEKIYVIDFHLLKQLQKIKGALLNTNGKVVSKNVQDKICSLIISLEMFKSRWIEHQDTPTDIKSGVPSTTHVEQMALSVDFSIQDLSVEEFSSLLIKVFHCTRIKLITYKEWIPCENSQNYVLSMLELFEKYSLFLKGDTKETVDVDTRLYRELLNEPNNTVISERDLVFIEFIKEVIRVVLILYETKTIFSSYAKNEIESFFKFFNDLSSYWQNPKDFIEVPSCSQTMHVKSTKDQQTPVNSAKDQHTPVKSAKDQETSVNSAKDQETSIKSANTQQTPVKSAKDQQTPIKSANTQEIPVKSANTQQTPVKSAKDQQTPVKSAKDQQTPVKSANTQQTPVKSAKDQQTPVKSAKDQQTPVKSAKDQQIPVKSTKDQQIPVKSAKDQQIPVNSAKDQQTPIKSANTQEIPVKSARTQQTPVKSAKDQQTPVKSAKDQQTPVKSTKDQQIPVKSVKDQQIPVKSAKDQQTPAKSAKDQQIPVKSANNQQIGVKLEKAQKMFNTLLLRVNNKIAEQNPDSRQVLHDNAVLLLGPLRDYLEFCKNPSQKTWNSTEKSFAKINITEGQKEKVSLLGVTKELTKFVIHNHGCNIPHNLNKDLVASLILRLESFIQLYGPSTKKIEKVHDTIKSNSTVEKQKSVNDVGLKNILVKANNLITNEYFKNHVPSAHIASILSFSNAMKAYINYCETGLKPSFDQAITFLKHLSLQNKGNDKYEDLLNALQKMKNAIVHTNAPYYIPSVDLQNKIVHFISALDILILSNCNMNDIHTETNSVETSSTKQGKYENSFHKIAININNLIENDYTTMVPCKNTQDTVVMSINALSSYIHYCMAGVTNNKRWKEVQIYFHKMHKMIGKGSTNNIDTKLLKFLEKMKHVLFSIDGEILAEKTQDEIRSIIATLKMFQSSWNKVGIATNSAKGGLLLIEPMDNDTKLISLLKQVRVSAEGYSGIPSSGLQQEILDTVKQLQKCSSSWEKRSREKQSEVTTNVESSLISWNQVTKKSTKEKEVANKETRKTKDSKMISKRNSQEPIGSLTPEKTKQYGIPEMCLPSYQTKSVINEIPRKDTSHGKVQATNEGVPTAFSRLISEQLSQVQCEEKIRSTQRKYSENLVTTIPYLNSTINKFIFDEISMTKDQIKSLNSALEQISPDGNMSLQSFKDMLSLLKSKDILDGKTVRHLDILINSFENLFMQGKKSDKELHIEEKENTTINGNENYLQRFNDTIENSVHLARVVKDTCDLSKFEESARAFVDSVAHEVCPQELQNHIDNKNDSSDDEDDWSDASTDIEDENNFTITREDKVLVIELNNEHLIEPNSPFSVFANIPDDRTIVLTNKRLKAYNAFMIMLDDENKLKLEFPNVSSFLLFAQDNQDIIERLNLIHKEQISRRKSILFNPTMKQLNMQCVTFIQSDESITNQVDNLLNTFLMCMQNKVNETIMLRDLGNVLKTIYPNHVLYTFGSRSTGQALPDSDCDVYCDVTGYQYISGINHQDQIRSVSKLGTLLNKSQQLFSNVFALTRTRVPIVRVFHKATRLNCDISFKNGTSVENTRLLVMYLKLDPRVPWLVAAVKLWAHYNHIQGSSYFTSHALTWLVLFFLMRKHVVPPVMEVQLSGAKTKIIDDWNVGFERPKQWHSTNETSALDLFKQFFAWIAHEDLIDACLCTYTGEIIPKQTFVKLHWMKTYKNGVFKKYAERLQLKRTPSKRTLSSYDMMEMNENIGLCVQDPFEHNKNCSKPVRGDKYKNFICLSKDTDRILNCKYQ
ncbi:hypothetical protein M8J76_010208 [Diaphorina citri]|nr:hypothetical protein M8J76_010208 [Diaphorina citri]